MWCVPSASAAASSAIGGSGAFPITSASRTMFLAAFSTSSSPRGELEHVLGLERGRERLRQRQSQLALAVVGDVLALADAGRGRLVAGGPFGERVEPGHGRVGLCPKRAEHVGSPRQEPAPRAHASAGPDDGDDGAEHGRRRERREPSESHGAHDCPAYMAPAPAADPDADHRRGDDMRGRHGRADDTTKPGSRPSRRTGSRTRRSGAGGRCAGRSCGRSSTRPSRCRA